MDSETNLYYFNARFYDAEIGRFITEDPAQDGLNWYGYCNDNPLKFVDPTGLTADKAIETHTRVDKQTYNTADAIASFICRTAKGIAMGIQNIGIAIDFMKCTKIADLDIIPNVPEIESGDYRVTTTKFERLENKDILITTQNTHRIDKDTITSDPVKNRFTFVKTVDGVNYYNKPQAGPHRLISEDVIKDLFVKDTKYTIQDTVEKNNEKNNEKSKK